MPQQGRRAGEADAQFATFSALHALHKVDGMIDTGKNLTGFCQERHPRPGQGNAPVTANKQACTEHLFQKMNLLTERRLRDTEPFCRAAEVQFFGDGDEIA